MRVPLLLHGAQRVSLLAIVLLLGGKVLDCAPTTSSFIGSPDSSRVVSIKPPDSNGTLPKFLSR